MTMRGDEVWAVVLAAGSGTRFGGTKQFAQAGQRRLVDLAVLAATASCDHVVVALPPGGVWDGPPVSATVEGGQSRQASVRVALEAVPDAAAIIVVHQAAHPLATPALFRTVIDAVRAGDAATVPGLQPRDVVCRVAGGRLIQDVGRDDLVILQTPSAFRADVLRAAHAAGRQALEDTALVAALGEQINVVPGDPRNIHVTTDADLQLVGCLLPLTFPELAGG